MRTKKANPAAEPIVSSVPEPEKKPLDPSKWIGPNTARESPLSADFQTIVETMVIHDVAGTYRAIEDWLKRIGEQRSDYGTVLKTLDEAEEYARKAHRLLVTAQIEERRWTVDNIVVHGAIREEAMRVLEREKDEGKRKKAITEADVEGMAAKLFSDQYRAQEMGKEKAKRMVKSLENLVDACNSRCRTLQTILSKQR